MIPLNYTPRASMVAFLGLIWAFFAELHYLTLCDDGFTKLIWCQITELFMRGATVSDQI